MPTMDAVVGHLGEPLEFWEYSVDDTTDDGESECDWGRCDSMDTDTEQRGAQDVPMTTFGVVEASSPSDSGGARAGDGTSF